jgi:hypothetical protein
MSNTISEGEIVIKDELPEAELIKPLQIPVKIEENEEIKEVVFSIAENKLERFEISTLDQEEAEPIKIHNLRPKKHNPYTIKPEPKVKKEVVVAYKDTETNTYHCDKCDRTFKGEGYLRRHQQNHDTNKIFACPKCDKAFKQKIHLQCHLLMHGKQANYGCKICGKRFKTPQYLHQHSFIHKETRDFQCDLCEKSFKSSSNLTQHKYCHVTEKAFACSICGKAFKKRAVMKIHELGHTTSICLGCGVIFKEKLELKAHRAECLKYSQYKKRLNESRQYK